MPNEYHVHPGCQVPALDELYLKYIGYITDGYFVEVGAFNCVNWSNTHHLAQLGWHGLLFEPQAQYYQDCMSVYRDHPKIKIVQSCVGDHDGTIKLYLGGSLSTTDTERLALYNELEWAKFSGLSLEKWTTVPLCALDTILEAHHWPVGFELLVIDVEGAELDVLAGFDIDHWAPKLVVIETHKLNESTRLSSHAGDIDDFFFTHDYEEVYCDHINSVYHKLTT